MADAQAKRALEVDLLEDDRKKSKLEKKEERKKEKKERKAEKKAKKERKEEEAEHWRAQIANTPQRSQMDSREMISPPRKETLKTYSEACSSTSRNIESMPAGNEDRLQTAENDINTLYKDTDVLFSGMKQMQKQQNYLMQRDNNQARKEANMQAVISNWPTQAQEQDRDRIIDWLVGNAQIPPREFQYASHKVQADSLSRISTLHFCSIWATRKFLDSTRRIASERNPLPYWQADNTIPKDNAGNTYFLRIKQQISTPDRIRSIPLKAFLQVINDSPNCEYSGRTRDLYKNWSANTIATENGNLMKCIFNDAEGTVKMLIRDDLFAMVEKDSAQAWKKVTTKNADEEFSNMKGKGKGKGKGPTSRGIQDYLYNVHLVKVSPNETDFDEEDL